jgi:DNA-directed RNA polymerase specialized sigma24 family protein
MDENEWLADRFEEHRVRLQAVAHRMLGSLDEADDAVQDTPGCASAGQERTRWRTSAGG